MKIDPVNPPKRFRQKHTGIVYEFIDNLYYVLNPLPELKSYPDELIGYIYKREGITEKPVVFVTANDINSGLAQNRIEIINQ